MIRKIRAINNVGKFVNFAATPDLEFEKLNLIYAENGRGKTTIAHILRSLATGDVNYIKERITAGVTTDSEIEIELDTQVCSFRSLSWDSTYTDIEIFDTTFVNNNIHSGYTVDTEHKRELYRFVIGNKGVALSTQIDRLTEEISLINTEIRNVNDDIRAVVSDKISVEDFLKLPFISDIEQQIASKQREIEVLQNKDKVVAQSILQVVSLPEIPMQKLTDVLAKQLADVSQLAANKVREHIRNCMDERGEGWLRQGMSYIKDDTCPFCGQSVSASELVEAYEGYFSQAYEALKKEIRDFETSVKTQFSQNVIREFVNQIAQNEKMSEFWKQHHDTDYPSINIAHIQSVWDAGISAIQNRLSLKSQSPLEIINLDEDSDNKLSDYTKLALEVSSYNEDVKVINERLNQIKSDASSGSLDKARVELGKLEFIKKRNEEYNINLCNKYQELENKKSDLEKNKKATRIQLDNHTDSLMVDHEKQLNEYLDKFMTGFKIKQRKPKFSGGKGSSDYSIEIHGVEIELGDAKTEGKPSFKSILSEGDKNTLAFAFFVTQLDMMDKTELEKKIIVVDDPISSLDIHRKARTQEIIEQLSERVKQVIVLSHDHHFLFTVWDKIRTKKDSYQVFQIVRDGAEFSKLSKYDINQEVQSSHVMYYGQLQDYLSNGAKDDIERRQIAANIRILLESHLKLRFPNEFKKKKAMLGDFLSRVKDPKSTEVLHQQIRSSNILPEITLINEYSRKYHHTDNSDAAKEPINDIELQDFVRRTLALIHGV